MEGYTFLYAYCTGTAHDSDDVKVPSICVLPNNHYAVHMAPRNEHHMYQDSHAFNNDWNDFMVVWNRDQRQEDFITLNFPCFSFPMPRKFEDITT